MKRRCLVVRGEPVAGQIMVATSLIARMRGLLGRTALSPGEGLLIVPCASIHTWFMRFPIDVVFLDRRNRVTRAAPRLAPWRFALGGKGAHAALELPAGWLDAVPLERGEAVSWGPAAG